MRVYVEQGFKDHFLSLPRDHNMAVKILWNIIDSYAEVTWVFNADVSLEDFERREVSDILFAKISSKGSNEVLVIKDFKEDLKKYQHDAQIYLAAEKKDWHEEIKHKVLLLTPERFAKTLQAFEDKFTFKFIPDENNSWQEFGSLRTNLVSTITITDKYILAAYLDKNNIKKFDNNFVFLINKILHSGDEHLKVLIKSSDLDRGRYDDLKKKLTALSSYLKERLHPDIKITVINAELDGDYDFHDRNIITPYYIVKAGKGFERVGRKSVNTEVECYSLLDKWGYDLIRHRYRMIKNYEESIATMNTPFKAITI